MPRWSTPRLRLPALLVALTAATAATAEPVVPVSNPDYAKAVGRVVEMAADLQSYDLQGTMAMTNNLKGEEGGPSVEARLVAAARWPDRLLSVQEGQSFSLHLGTGPQESWFFLGQLGNAYVGEPVMLRRDLAGAGEMDLSEAKIFNFYGGLGPFLLEPDLPVAPDTGREDLDVDGRTVPCLVFTTPGTEVIGDDGQPVEGPRRIHYDPASGLVLRSELTVHYRRSTREMQQNVVFALERFALNGELDDDRFTYEPPAGVRVVNQLDRLTNPDAMTGQLAPDITFKTLDGDEFSLSSLRGKPIFIDFWATWCGPCRQEMPHIETLYREFGKTGRMRFFAASSEARATIEGFLTKNPYTFPVVTVDPKDAQTRYKTTSIPVGFVIDAGGVIRAHMVGAQSEAQLRAAFAKVGVE